MVPNEMAAIDPATKIIHFINHSCKLATSANEIYGTVNESTCANTFYTKQAAVIVELAEQIRQHPSPGRTGIDRQLNDVGNDCLATAKKLHELLEKIAVHENAVGVKNFVAAARTVWEKKHVDALIHRIGELYDAMSGGLLALLT
jgi:hypothetical protein